MHIYIYIYTYIHIYIYIYIYTYTKKYLTAHHRPSSRIFQIENIGWSFSNTPFCKLVADLPYKFMFLFVFVFVFVFAFFFVFVFVFGRFFSQFAQIVVDEGSGEYPTWRLSFVLACMAGLLLSLPLLRGCAYVFLLLKTCLFAVFPLHFCRHAGSAAVRGIDRRRLGFLNACRRMVTSTTAFVSGGGRLG